jgi:hypothetical protein
MTASVLRGAEFHASQKVLPLDCRGQEGRDAAEAVGEGHCDSEAASADAGKNAMPFSLPIFPKCADAECYMA